MATVKQISLDEVRKHRSQKSLWIIINNEVLDVTKFIDEHPGGADTLLEAAGKDATQAFEDVGHSSDARSMLKKYKIGVLPPNEINNAQSCRLLASSRSRDRPPEVCSSGRIGTIIVPRESCPGQVNLAKKGSSPRPEKIWRTFDGSPSSRSLASSRSRDRPPEVCSSGRVGTIVVPRERPPKKKGTETDEGNSNLKWVLLLLGAVIILGFAYKKYSE